MLFEVRVDVLDHRRQRRRLAGPGGARHENDASWGPCNRLDDRHQAQFLEAGHLGLHITHGQGKAASLLEDIGTETAHTRFVVAEVHLAVVVHAAAGMGGNHSGKDFTHPLLGRSRRVDGDELPADAEHHWGAHLDVNVRGPAFNCGFEDSAQQICVVAHEFWITKASKCGAGRHGIFKKTNNRNECAA